MGRRRCNGQHLSGVRDDRIFTTYLQSSRLSIDFSGRCSRQLHDANPGRTLGQTVARGRSRRISTVTRLERITRDYRIMGGRPCIRGMRVTVGTIVGLLAQGHSREAVLDAYPYLEPEDLAQALTYAAWRAMEVEWRSASRNCGVPA